MWRRNLFFGAILVLALFFSPQKVFAGANTVVINEVSYNPSGTDTGLEWVELFNAGEAPQELTGDDLYAAGSYYTFGDFTLGAGDYVVIHINTAGEDTPNNLYQGESENMGNSSGTIALFKNETHNATTILDFVRFGELATTWQSAAVSADIWASGDFVVAASEGQSLTRFPNGIDNDASGDWANSEYPTPNEKNVVSKELPALLLPEKFLPADKRVFNKAEVDFSWDNPNKQPVEFQLVLSKNDDLLDPIINKEELTEPLFSVDSLDWGKYFWQLTVSNAEDEISTDIFSFTLAEPIYSKAIIVNELFPAPINNEPENEWIELYNDSDEAADLENWILEDIKGATEKYELPVLLIPPREYIILKRPATGITLNNDTDGIRLYQPNGNLIFETPCYESATKGYAWMRGGDGKFRWTATATPEKTNEFYLPPEEETEDDPAGGDDEKMVINKKPIKIETGKAPHFENKLVEIQGNVVSTSGRTFFLDDGSGQAKVYLQSKTQIIKPAMRKNDIFAIVGIVDFYRGTYRILPRTQSDIELIESSQKTLETIPAPKIVRKTTVSKTAQLPKINKPSIPASIISEPLVQEAKAAVPGLSPPKEDASTPIWFQFIKAIVGLAIVLLVLLIIKIDMRPKIKVVGGRFGRDQT